MKIRLITDCFTCFIINLGKIATFNGGLTNSAIDRANILSKLKEYKSDKFVIFYCSEIQSTLEIEDYYRKKYNLSSNISFINAHDFVNTNIVGNVIPIAHKRVKNRYEGYIVNGISLDYSEYMTYCLNKFIAHCNAKLIYLFMDVPLVPDYRILISDYRVKKIFLTHSEHLKYHKTCDIHWKKNFYKARAYFQPIEDPSVFTVSFSKIQHDFIKFREGNKKNYLCIPHYYNVKNKHNLKRKNKIVWVGRVTNDVKKIQLAIDSYIHSKVDIPFEIYGDGEELEAMKKYVKQQKYEHKISFKGHTDDIDYIFQSSILSLSITEYEGFGLSILESLRNGCPVIASDVFYGPKEMIKDGENGFLVKNEVLDISNTINKFITNNMFTRFSDFAKVSSEKYSKQHFINNWIEAISYISQKQDIIYLSPITSEAYVEKSKLIVYIESQNDCYLRVYDKELKKFTSILLKQNKNKIDINLVQGKLISIIQLSDFDFKEYSINIDKNLNNDLCYKSIRIPSWYNSIEEFKFVYINF